MRFRSIAPAATASAAVTSVVGAIVLVGSLYPAEAATRIVAQASTWFDLLAAFAFIAGGQSLVAHHMRRMSDRESGWRYSAVTVGAFATTLCAGVFKLGAPSWETPLSDPGTWFRRIADTLYAPVQGALAVVAAFALVFALYRAARGRLRSIWPMLACAGCVLVANTPIDPPFARDGGVCAPACAFARAAYEILAAVGGGAQRALLVCVAGGVIATALRIVLRAERPS